MSKLEYCPEKGDYYLDNWLAVVIVGHKALLQQREGKKFRLAILTGTRVTEVQVGNTQRFGNLGYRATSNGWKED